MGFISSIIHILPAQHDSFVSNLFLFYLRCLEAVKDGDFLFSSLFLPSIARKRRWPKNNSKTVTQTIPVRRQNFYSICFLFCYNDQSKFDGRDVVLGGYNVDEKSYRLSAIVIDFSCLLFFLAGSSLAKEGGYIDIGSRRELFVDHYLIDKLEGARLKLHHPRDEGSVLKFDAPWEGPFCGYVTVIKDRDKYRFYYRGLPQAGRDGNSREVTCYAESQDGIHVVKPKLNLFTVQGSASNNVVLADAAPVHHNFSPFLDTRPDVPADERFKALGGTKKSGLIAYVCADGIHWKRLRDEPVFSKGIFDSQNVSFWSESEQCYLCYFRTWTKTNYGGFRSVSRTTSKDFVHWTEPVEMSFGQTPREHIYTNQTHPYFRAPHIYIAIAARFMPGRQVLTEQQAKQVNVNPNYFKDCSDAVLMTSRGGNVYDRTFMEGFNRPGIGLQNWVSRSNYPALNVVQTGPAEMSLYVQHDYAQPTAHLRRYALRLDGFVSVSAPYEGGSMTTKPFVFSGDELLLNFATSAAGSVRVEIQNADGTPIPGYSAKEAQELIGNTVERPARWKAGTDVSALAGRPIRLHFIMKDADLYSLQFQPSDSKAHRYKFPEVAELPVQEGLPDPLRMRDGSRVTTREDWNEQRDYLKQMLAHYLYGHMPPRPKQIKIEKTSTANFLGGSALEEHYTVTISRNSKSLSFKMALVRPVRKARRAVIVKNCHALFDPNALAEGDKGRVAARRDRNAARMAVERGYILSKFIRTDIAPDRKDNRSEGVFQLYPEYNWGTIAAWAWAHQIVVDVLDRLDDADMDKIVATGHSRGGKTALCAGIYDERVAITAPNSSGTGGTGSMRYFEPGQRSQTVAYLVKAHPHWWTLKYADFANQPDRLPFDSHFMKALIAPRGLINCHARQDYWANPYGTELTYRAAQKVFDWLGVGEHQGIHWRQGGHAQNEEDWRALLDFADKFFFGKHINRRFDVLAYPDAKVPMP